MQTYFLLRFSLMDSLEFVSELTFRLLEKINFKIESPNSLFGGAGGELFFAFI